MSGEEEGAEAAVLDSGLFGIQLSSDSEGDGDGDGEGQKKKPPKPEKGYARDAQSEEAFQAVRRDYRVKVENGEIWRTISLPLDGRVVTKPEAQALLHAVEELFFLRRYAEGAQFARRALGGDDGGENQDESVEASGLDDDMRSTLRYYESRCNARAAQGI